MAGVAVVQAPPIIMMNGGGNHSSDGTVDVVSPDSIALDIGASMAGESTIIVTSGGENQKPVANGLALGSTAVANGQPTTPEEAAPSANNNMAAIGNGAAEGGAGAVSSVAVVSAAVEGSTTEVTTVSIESGSVMTTTEVTTVTVKNTQEEVSAAAAPATLPVTMAEPVTMGEGPDKVVPASKLRTWHREDAVKLRISAERGSYGSEEPISVVTAFENITKMYPNHTAMAVKKNNAWVKWTYTQYLSDTKKAAKSFIKLGLEPMHGVGIIGFNSPEWFISNLGAIFAGGFAVGIYTTNTPEACQYVAANCDANVLVVENNQQLQKILKVQDSLPHLKAIVQYSGELAAAQDNLYTWQQFMALGEDVPDSALQMRISNQAPNKCCSLIYTSGTTGNPKGVMLSHDNLTWTAATAGRFAGLRVGEEVSISYLPLSHIAAQLIDIYLPLRFASTVFFAQPDALKGSLGTTLKEVRPTAFMGVPRVWEKMMESIKLKGRETRGLKRKVVDWAKSVGLRGNYSLMNNGSTPFGWAIANKLLFQKIRTILGFDRCRIFLTGAAPIMKDTLDFFLGLNIPLNEIYGMSESTGPHTLSTPAKWRVASVGTDMDGARTVLADKDAEGNGEICMDGRHVFMGYLNMEEKTMEALDDEGLLHSGDVGKKDKDGFLFITGRIKELLITAGGENVPPVPIEDKAKEELPIISNAMLIGDKKKFLAMLLTLKVEVDGDGVPQDKLTVPALDWCKSVGSSATTLTDILDNKDEKVLKAIQEGIDRTNKRSTSRAQIIQKWSILPRDFSIPGGELGPTLKLKRPVVTKMYKNTIEAFYA